MTHAALMPHASQRLPLLDGLRGIAAFSVCAHHMSGAVVEELNRSAEHLVHAAIAYGALGVDVFFVLSGFVICMSLDGDRIGGRYVGCFMARRSLRLDPPYLASLALVIAITTAASMIGATNMALPTIPQLLAHLFYLQNILGYPDLNPVNWTLCMEVQFYLVFVLLLACIQGTVGTTESRRFLGNRVWLGLLALLAVMSATVHADYVEPPIDHLFIEHWYQFFLGVVVYWCRKGYLPKIFVPVYCLVVLGISMSGKPNAGDPVAAVAALLLLYAAGSRALSYAPIQFLGRISYSLYLVHIPVGWTTVALIGRLTPGTESELLSIGAGVAGVASSLISAYIMYRVIEAPSVRLSRKLGERCLAAVRSRAPASLEPAVPVVMPDTAQPSK